MHAGNPLGGLNCTYTTKKAPATTYIASSLPLTGGNF